MRKLPRSATVGILTVALAACVTPPPPGVPMPPTAQVLPADARALRYGASAPAVFESAELRDKVRALFGGDWVPASQGGRLQYGAAEYFPVDSQFRLLRVDNRDYIAISGCVPHVCPTHRGLVLISADGQELWGRLDEGGFSRYYGHGPAMTGARVSPTFIDAAWRAVEGVEGTAAGPPAGISA